MNGNESAINEHFVKVDLTQEISGTVNGPSTPEAYGASPQNQNLGREAAYWNQPLSYRRAAEICINRCSSPTNLAPGISHGCLLTAGVSAVERNSIGEPTVCKVLVLNQRCDALERLHPELESKPAA